MASKKEGKMAYSKIFGQKTTIRVEEVVEACLNPQ
jgi:hypothetical protein